MGNFIESSCFNGINFILYLSLFRIPKFIRAVGWMNLILILFLNISLTFHFVSVSLIMRFLWINLRRPAILFVLDIRILLIYYFNAVLWFNLLTSNLCQFILGRLIILFACIFWCNLIVLKLRLSLTRLLTMIISIRLWFLLIKFVCPLWLIAIVFL